MKSSLRCLIFTTLSLLIGCDSGNLNKGGPPYDPNGIHELSIVMPGPAEAGGQAEIFVHWKDGQAPYQVDWIFSGEVTPLQQTTSAEGNYAELQVELDELDHNERSNLTVRVTDARGKFSEHNFSFEVIGDSGVSRTSAH